MNRFCIIIFLSFFIFACSSVSTPTNISKFSGIYQGAVITTRELSSAGTAIIVVGSDGSVKGEIRIESQGTIDIITVETDPIYVIEISEYSYSIKLSNYNLYLNFIDSGNSVKIECVSSTTTISGTLTKK